MSNFQSAKNYMRPLSSPLPSSDSKSRQADNVSNTNAPMGPKIVFGSLKENSPIDMDDEVGAILSSHGGPSAPTDLSPTPPNVRHFSRTPGPKKIAQTNDMSLEIGEASPSPFKPFKDYMRPVGKESKQGVSSSPDLVTITRLLETPIDKMQMQGMGRDEISRLISPYEPSSSFPLSNVSLHSFPLTYSPDQGKAYRSPITRYSVKEEEDEEAPSQYHSDSSGSQKTSRKAATRYESSEDSGDAMNQMNNKISQMSQMSQRQSNAGQLYSSNNKFTPTITQHKNNSISVMNSDPVPPLKNSSNWEEEMSRSPRRNAPPPPSSQLRHSGGSISFPLPSNVSNKKGIAFAENRRSHEQYHSAGTSSGYGHPPAPSSSHDYLHPPYLHSPSLTISTSHLTSSKNSNDPLDSPNSKQYYKDFSVEYRAKWKISYQEAKNYALLHLPTMPHHARWRVYLDLAELSKKLDDADKAREYYRKACEVCPRASTIWLEWSKMEEENGRVEAALRVLVLGVVMSDQHESLLPRLLKIYERMHKTEHIRGILSQLKGEGIEKSWKMMLEGALFEAREGRVEVARKIFRYLMKHMHWHGPVFHEAFKLEEREGRDDKAVQIAYAGLGELKHYGPLWFGLISAMERKDVLEERRLWQRGETPILRNITAECQDAVRKISKELVWRVYYEKYQAEERSAEISSRGLYYSTYPSTLLQCRREMVLSRCRTSLVQSLLKCPTSPNNLRWRIFLVGARLEVSLGNEQKARTLLKKAYEESPGKSKVFVIIECSRLEEYLGRVDIARQILQEGKAEMGNDWKAYLERILLEMRVGDMERALVAAREAVQCHPGTGRLWSLYIQLLHRVEHRPSSSSACSSVKKISNNKLSVKDRVIRKAISEVPKSGEVWCEQARCVLNPFYLHRFDLGRAMQACSFAISFTPQYGDSFIEYLRLEILSGFYLPAVCRAIGISYRSYVKKHLSYDKDSDQYNAIHKSSYIENSPPKIQNDMLEKIIVDIYNMDYEFSPLYKHNISYQHLLQRCINADPNYGTAWFHCRQLPYDIPSVILKACLECLVREFNDSHPIYGRAILHYLYTTLISDSSQSVAERQFVKTYEQCMRSFPALRPEGLVSPYLPQGVRGRIFTCEDFVTAFVSLNKTLFNPYNNLDGRRKLIYGSDQVIS